jgi:tetratricopeptide (TPR) repeat protein
MGLCGFVSCIGQREAQPPSAGGNPWAELTTPHFQLYTDLAPEAARNVVTEYEHVYQLLAKATFGNTAAPEFLTQGVVFRTFEELHPYVPAQAGGVYKWSLPDDIEHTPTMLVFGTLSPFGRTLFAHELAHRFNRVSLGAMPVWLNEGLAEYYSTIRGDVESPIVGESDPQNVVGLGTMGANGDAMIQGQTLHLESLPKPSALLAFDDETFYARGEDEHAAPSWRQQQAQSQNYAAAWLLVYFLLHEPAAYAQRFRERLGHPGAEHNAGMELQALLTQLDPAELDRDFAAFLRKSIPWRQHHEVARTPGPVPSRELSDAQVLTLWARLDAFEGPNAKRAAERLARAHQSDANDPDVWFWGGRLHAREGKLLDAERYYTKASELGPDRAEFLLALALLYWQEGAAQAWPMADRQQRSAQAFAKLKPIARTPRELAALTQYALSSGDIQSALRFGQQSTELGPDCWDCFHVYATAAFASGDYPHAMRLETAAIAQTPSGVPTGAFRVMHDAIGLYSRLARDPSAARPAHPPPALFLD